MLFSEHFRITRADEDDWFDPFLTIDSRLFLDPFLIYARPEGVFAGSHQDIINYFNAVFELIAEAGCRPSSPLYRKAVSDLLLPEAEELCLGYTTGGTKGLGSGGELANLMATAIAEAIGHGLTQLRHLEEISILREGIGADRISDATANVLRARIVRYTEEVCHKYLIPVTTRTYRRGRYDSQSHRWIPITASLPVNPYNHRPIFLVPAHYLNSLPTINPEDFWDYCVENENDILRNEFNLDIARNISKERIVQIARRHPELRERYVDFVESQAPMPYDFKEDKKGVAHWYEPTREFCRENPLKVEVTNDEEFQTAVDQMVEAFRHFIEQKKGWQLLWDDDGRSRSENVAQLTMLAIISSYCEANNIDVSREAEVGRGPVDFKVSRGYRMRSLIEVKLARNTRFWDGVAAQFPTYLKAEKVSAGYFVVVVYTAADAQRIRSIQNAIATVNRESGLNVKALIVDARPKLSASRLRRQNR